jgi:hypothetical protein
MYLGEILAPGPRTATTCLGLAAEKHPADSVTEAMVRSIAAEGERRAMAFRGSSPALECSDVTAAAITLLALQLYGPDKHKQEYEKRPNVREHGLFPCNPEPRRGPSNFLG